MDRLEERIVELRARLAVEPGNTALQAKLAAMLAEYAGISQSLGGDRAMGPDTQPADSPTPPRSLNGIVPAGPPGCSPTTTMFTQTTPVTIPTGPAVVTSTIVVSGVGPVLLDVNAMTNLTHTFAADLDVTLRSPAGTVVTMTTDNGGGADNVFNGTMWDDDANPAGQVPYTTNNGLATDQAYVNLSPVPTLEPEESMGAFIGENPNGTWTLTISDDLGGDGGNLASWALEVSTLATAPSLTSSTFTQSTPVPIPTGPAVVTSTIVVSGAAPYLFDLNMTTFMAHTWSDDLDVTLMSPAGTIVTITTDNGFDNAQFVGGVNVFNGTFWDDDANPAGQVPYATNNGVVTDHLYVTNVLASPLVPEEALAAFIGENPNGTWTLTISDDTALDGGNLSSWSLNVTTATCCAINCPANVTQANDVNQCGAVVNYPAPTTTGSCGPVTCSPPTGSFFPVGTTTVTCTEQIILQSPEGQQGLASCTFTVTVNDTQPPAITCPANVTQANDANQCGAVVTYAAPTVSDNCPGVGTPACSPPSGSFFPVGTTTVTCTVSDASPNSADSTCMFTVTINDTQAPTITCPANVTQANDANQCGAVVNFPAPTASDNCPGVTVSCSPASGSFFPRGTTTVTCTAMDVSPNSPNATCMFTVTVNDTQPPAITCPANITTVGTLTAGCQLSGVVTYAAPTVSDNCPGVGVPTCVPASGSTFAEGTTTVTCTVTDSSANTATCSFTITVTAVGAFGACAVDDASGDTFSIVTDPASPLFRFWRYRVAATGEIFCGTASQMAFIPNRSLTATDNDDVRFYMNANLSYSSFSGTVKVIDYATGRQFVIKDRNLRNNPPCQ